MPKEILKRDINEATTLDTCSIGWQRRPKTTASASTIPRTIGAKDRAAGGRVRNETDEAKAERAKKSADTRAAKQKRKINDERAATAGRRAARM